MFTCPNCDTKSIPFAEKLSCTRAQPIVCPNCNATLKLPAVSLWAVIAGGLLGVLLFPILTGVAFVHGMEALILGYFALAAAVSGFATFAKVTSTFELEKSS